MTLIKKQSISDLIILSIRILLGIIFISYGFSKLTHGQFGLYDKSVLNQPLKLINSFQLTWYLFGMEEPFKYVIGSLQIFSGVLMLFNRTFLIGAILYLPLIFGVCLINVSFVKIDALSTRTICYMLLDLFVLYVNKDKILAAYHLLTEKIEHSLKYNIKTCFFAIIIAISFEALSSILVNAIFNLIHKTF
jgi:uncharacterized membrane protein YphA (DoxX/SURF4 family)